MTGKTESSLKKQVSAGFAWRFLERILAQLVTFLVSIVLARLLDPEHYAIISLTTIFITVANVFVAEGIGKALVQKKQVSDTEFSTMFFINLGLSAVLYLLIWFAAPFIAQYYNEPLLTSTLRVLSLRLPLAAVNSIQQAYVSRRMEFKLFFKATITGTLVSAAVGIFLAYRGYGVWALVGQYLTNSAIDTIMLWFMVKWRPIRSFSFEAVRPLFKLGVSITGVGLMNALYNNLSSFLIGKKYTKSDLAFFTRGIHYPNLIIANINTTLGTVMYPAFSKVQDDKKRLKSVLRRSIRLETFIIFPLMGLMFSLAPEIVSFLVTDKWLPCVPYMRIGCIYLSLYPINTINLQAIMATGNGKLYFRLNVIKKLLGILLIILAIPYGVLWVAYSEIAASLLAVVTNTAANRKLIGYSFAELTGDVLSNILFTILLALTVFGGKKLFLFLPLHLPLFLRIVILALLGGAGYLLCSWLFRSRELMEVVHIIRNKIRKK